MDQQQKKAKILISLDQSTNVTGYAVFLQNSLIDYGHTDFSGDYLDRIVQLREWLIKKINDYKKDHSITILIEDIQLQQNVNSNVLTYKKLAHVQGVLLELFTELNVSYKIISSSTWRHICDIKGKDRAERKKNAQKLIFDRFKVQATQDEADAICIGLSEIKNQEESFDWT